MKRPRANGFGLIALLLAPWLGAADAFADPIIAVEPETFHFDNVIRGSQVTTVFTVHNRGKSKNLEISLIKTSCGCSATLIEKTSIPPNDSTPLRVNFDSSEYLGTVNKSIALYSNATNEEEYGFNFTADVISMVSVNPESFNFGTLNLLQEGGNKLNFSVAFADPAGKITGMSYNEDYFAAACKESTSPDLAYECELSVKPSAPSGGILEELRIQTNVDRQPSYKVPIYGRLKGAFELLPMLVDFGELESGGETEEVVRITSVAGDPFKISKVESDRDDVVYRVEPGKDGNTQRVILRFLPRTVTGVVEGRVRIVTDHSESPEIQVKYQAYVE